MLRGAVLFILLGIAFPARLAAQPESPEDAPHRLEPVVVTATKTPTPAPTVGASITVIDKEEIQSRQSVEMPDVLRTVPGVRISEQGTQGGVALVEPRGAGFTFNQVLIDGVKVNDAGGVMNFAGLSLVNFERVEVLRGPQSGLYGPDAAGSVIQFFTTRGRGPFHTEVSAGAGNRTTSEETATLAGGAGPFGLSLGVHRVDTDGDLRHSDFRSTTLSARGDFGRADELELTLALRYVDSHVEVPVLVGGDLFVPLDPHQFVDQERLLVSPRVVHEIRPGWKQTLQLGYVQHNADIIDRFDPGIDLADIRAFPREDRYAADYFWTVTLPPVADVGGLATLGAAYEREAGRQRVVVEGPAPSTRNIVVDRELYSGYLQAQLDWRRRAFLISGFRVDESSVFAREVTPRVAAAVLLPVTETRLRSAYGEGIRAPSFIQLFGDGIGFVNGNPDLRPERARSWEVGVDQPLGMGGELSATYFQTRFDELIALVPGGTPGSFNVGEAVARGVEVSLKAYPTAWLTLTGAYTYLHTEILENRGIAVAESPEGAPLLRQPTHWGSVTADVAWRRLTASLSGLFVGEREDFNPVASPTRRVSLAPYARVDAALAYELVRKWQRFPSVALFARARNLTDERYEDFHGFSNPGTRVLVGLRASF